MSHVTRNLPVNSSLKQKLQLGVFLSNGKIGMVTWLNVQANKTGLASNFQAFVFNV